MARIRSVKPEFFRHKRLQRLEADHPREYPMLVFEGLWTVSDLEGRFAWDPDQLKLEILPFLIFNMERTLHLLAQDGCVVWYEVEGRPYGYIPSWHKHQKFNSLKNEKVRYPAPPSQAEAQISIFSPLQGLIPDKSVIDHGLITEGKGKGREKDKDKDPAAKARPVFLINKQPIPGSFWGMLIKECNGDQDRAARVLLRAKEYRDKENLPAGNIIAWIMGGIKPHGYCWNACKLEDDNPKAVREWIDEKIYKYKMMDV